MKNHILWATLFLRISLGWIFLFTGIEKLTQGFSAAGYLSHLQGPFSFLFSPMAGNALVDNLVIWGEILIGACLILGALVGFAAFWGVVMMLLFYLSGYPYEHSFIVNEHIIYILVLFYLVVSGSGHILGADKVLEKKFPQLKRLMG